MVDVKANNTTNVITALAMKEVKEPESPTVTVTATVPKAEVAEPPKPQIPPRPVMPPEAAAFPKLQKVKTALDKHNHRIFETERERNKLEIERDDLKGSCKDHQEKGVRQQNCHQSRGNPNPQGWIILYCQKAWIYNGAGFLHCILYCTACR